MSYFAYPSYGQIKTYEIFSSSILKYTFNLLYKCNNAKE